jgi:hypothetical protein
MMMMGGFGRSGGVVNLGMVGWIDGSMDSMEKVPQFFRLLACLLGEDVEACLCFLFAFHFDPAHRCAVPALSCRQMVFERIVASCSFPPSLLMM